MADYDDLEPKWRNLVKGGAEAEDLRTIKKYIAKKCINMLGEIDEKDSYYKRPYKQPSKNLKRGLLEKSTNQGKVSEHRRCQKSKSVSEITSAVENVDRKKEDQNDTYYITGESVDRAPTSSFIDSSRDKGIEANHGGPDRRVCSTTTQCVQEQEEDGHGQARFGSDKDDERNKAAEVKRASRLSIRSRDPNRERPN